MCIEDSEDYNAKQYIVQLRSTFSMCTRSEFLNMLLEYRSEVQKLEIVHKDNQGDILLVNHRQVGMRTKHINVRHPFLR